MNDKHSVGESLPKCYIFIKRNTSLVLISEIDIASQILQSHFQDLNLNGPPYWNLYSIRQNISGNSKDNVKPH
jgi:hypothetical protein